MQELRSPSGLTAHHLCCRRGDRWLFSDVSLSLLPGDALHLAGPNGVGKTSLLRILAGLLAHSASPHDTEAHFAWTGNIALLDERPALDPTLALGSALSFWAGIDGLDANGLDDNMARMGLTRLRDVPVRYLSTGQKKRAAMARLLGQRAANWLLDEPLNGLDHAGVSLVEELVADHRSHGGTAIVASHQPFVLTQAKRFSLGATPVEMQT